MGVGSLFPGTPHPPCPPAPSEPSLRPCIQGAWVLPPGAGLQAQTPRGGSGPSARFRSSTQETPAGTPTSLSAQAAPHAHHRWARGLMLLLQHLPRPCNHSRTRTTSWPRLLASAAQCPAGASGHTWSILALPSCWRLGKMQDVGRSGEHWETKGRNGGSHPPSGPRSGLDLSRPWEESWHRQPIPDAQAASVFHTDTQFWVEISLGFQSHCGVPQAMKGKGE